MNTESIITPIKLKRLEVITPVAAIIGPILSISLLLLSTGCSQTQPDRAERMTRGYIFFLDGAGGGSAISNWSAGLKKGLLDAGYDGAGEMFKWNTGLGIVADQDSSVEYKRSKTASDLGLTATNLHRWRRELEQHGGEAFPGNGRLRPAE